eukprot:symbB.v1.2.034049.t2/scaffold4326.1/size41202/4
MPHFLVTWVCCRAVTSETSLGYSVSGGIFRLSLCKRAALPQQAVVAEERRPHDIIIFGPGLVRLLVRSWAVVGRNCQRLESLASRCRVAPAILVQGQDLEEVTQQATVAISAAGPYSVCGEAVVRACVRSNTHYVDLSGETVWMHNMLQRYHEEAKSKGLVLVNACAQVCAIDDINCYLLAKHLGPLKAFREYFFSYGGTTGGTFLAGATNMEGMTEERFQIFTDPFNLGGRRSCGVRPEDYDCSVAAQDPVYPALWLFPAYNGHTGGRILRRSCELFEQGEGPSYGSQLSVMIRDAVTNRKQAEGTTASMAPPKSAEEAKFAAGKGFLAIFGRKPICKEIPMSFGVGLIHWQDWKTMVSRIFFGFCSPMSENGDYEEVSNSEESEEEQDEEEGNFEVLSQTTWCEKICLFFGSFLALLQGASAPLIAMFTGRAVNVLTTSDPGEVLTDMRGVLMKITVLAIAQFLLAWGWQTSLMWAAANQALRWQLLFLRSVLSLDISWFDTHEPAGLAAKLELEIAQVQVFMSAGLGFLISSIGFKTGGDLLNLIEERFTELEEEVALARLVPQLHDRLVVMEEQMKQLQDQGFLIHSSRVDVNDLDSPSFSKPLECTDFTVNQGPKWSEEDSPSPLQPPDDGDDDDMDPKVEAQSSLRFMIDLKSLPAGLTPKSLATFASPTRRNSQGLSKPPTQELGESLLDMQTQEQLAENL